MFDVKKAEWRTIPSFPDYEASDAGAVRRHESGRAPRKVLTKFPNRHGRARVTISTGGGCRKCLVSRLVCEAFHGPAPSGAHQAAHGDGNRSNDRADNLRWATRRENYEDQVRHGTSKRGEGHPQARLTEARVRAIRARAGTLPQKELAHEYGIAVSTVSMIVSRKLWPHVN